eukprot:924236-Pelagomonas_calceolata.AAC.1
MSRLDVCLDCPGTWQRSRQIYPVQLSGQVAPLPEKADKQVIQRGAWDVKTCHRGVPGMSKDATGDVMGCARDAVAGWQRFALGCKSPGHCVNDVNIAGAGEGQALQACSRPTGAKCSLQLQCKLKDLGFSYMVLLDSVWYCVGMFVSLSVCLVFALHEAIGGTGGPSRPFEHVPACLPKRISIRLTSKGSAH